MDIRPDFIADARTESAWHIIVRDMFRELSDGFMKPTPTSRLFSCVEGVSQYRCSGDSLEARSAVLRFVPCVYVSTFDIRAFL